MLGACGVMVIEVSTAVGESLLLLLLLLLLSNPTRMAPRPRAPTAAVATTAVVLLKNEVLVELVELVLAKAEAKTELGVRLKVRDNISARIVVKILGDLVWQLVLAWQLVNCLFVCLFAPNNCN